MMESCVKTSTATKMTYDLDSRSSSSARRSTSVRFIPAGKGVDGVREGMMWVNWSVTPASEAAWNRLSRMLSPARVCVRACVSDVRARQRRKGKKKDVGSERRAKEDTRRRENHAHNKDPNEDIQQ